MKRHAISIIFAAAITGCAPRDTTMRARAEVYLPTQVIAGVETLEGRDVVVEGYLTAGSDTRALWQSRDAYIDVEQQRRGSYVEYNYWTQCITLYGTVGGPNLWKLNKKYVRLTGTVIDVGPDAMWACNRVSLTVNSAMEVRR